jgi:hypothetical protein
MEYPMKNINTRMAKNSDGGFQRSIMLWGRHVETNKTRVRAFYLAPDLASKNSIIAAKRVKKKVSIIPSTPASSRRQQLCTHLAIPGTNNCTGRQSHDKKDGGTSKKWYVLLQSARHGIDVNPFLHPLESFWKKTGRPLRIKKRHTTSTCHMHVAAKMQKQKSIDNLFVL